MARIGKFKSNGDGSYTGEIATLTVHARNVEIVPQQATSNDAAPTHLVRVGAAEIGAGWAKNSTEGQEYLNLKLDDPSFTQPIFANLVALQGDDGFALIWTRS